MKYYCLVHFLTQQKGGRKEPPGEDYTTVARFEGKKEPWSLKFEVRPSYKLGKQALMKVQPLLEGAPMELGSSFDIFEGDKNVGSGCVVGEVTSAAT